MVIMSKASRLSERPKPPTWDEIVEDIGSAPNCDVVFSIGKDYLPQISGSLPSSLPETNLNSSTSSTGSPDSESDTSQIDQGKVEASYANVTRLMSLCSELKDVPADLLEQYAKLRDTGEEMTKSIQDLKELAQSIPNTRASSQTGKESGLIGDSAAGSEKAVSTSKGKSKPKKKK
ncbi:uncharacterized protein LOC101852965 [Aplysia californica]|uniref:Uncharacterized protein LOC101852965 n=1 Tax=Aplysia californica TaxID=6500 RepID=A0ABM0K7A4_APLCA|nr:uncharacterized protein LOC101852965 [Aplysia californica]